MLKRAVLLTAIVLLAPFAAAASPQDEADTDAPSAGAAESTDEPTETSEGTEPTESSDETEEAPAAESESDESAALLQRIEALEQQNEQQSEKIATLEEKAEADELAELEALAGETDEFDPTLNIYGFFDVSFFKWFFEKGSTLQGALPRHSTFAATDLNLYIHSQMTESLSFLAELRFTYLPHGSTDYNTFERRSTTIQDPHTNETLRMGGIYIERVHLTWQPKDWFGVTAGRFITPFGIWNIDHGSPVLLGSYAPYIMMTELVPLRQTGLMVHGRFVPTEAWFIDYALTVSNGRGPIEQVMDLDENKAVGLRLKTTFEKREFKLALGGYGYYGQSTNELMMFTALDPPILEFETTERFNELIGSVDLLVELFGVRVQAEYARSLRRYSTRPNRTLPMVGTMVADQYQPDFSAWVAYALLGWTLPLDAYIGDVKITPFAMAERSEPEDISDDFNLWSFRGGINVKPNSFVTIKLDGGYIIFDESELFPEATWTIGTQVAIAF